MTTELEIALARESTPAQLPIGLPLAHLTARRWLQAILNVGQLEPRPCKVLSKTVLYFSYGGVFYRTSTLQTERTSELPVALVVFAQYDECNFPIISVRLGCRCRQPIWPRLVSEASSLCFSIQRHYNRRQIASVGSQCRTRREMTPWASQVNNRRLKSTTMNCETPNAISQKSTRS
jgi:hypothetical protein